jgi:hypothetical protein
MSTRLKTAYLKVTTLYMVIILGTFLLVKLVPGIVEFLPVGTTEKMFTTSEYQEFIETSVHAGKFQDDPTYEYPIFFLLCFVCSILVAIPVGTTYLGTHSNKKTSASIAKMIIGLPIVVTGLVLIVQNSLALAFSLAGIVAGAGIRFRTNLKEFTDTLFFLVSIGIGISAGIGALGISFIMSLVFCYTILTIHAIGYGEVNTFVGGEDSEQIPTEKTSSEDE